MSSNCDDTARYSDRAPSEGMYEFNDVRTIFSRVAGGIVAAPSPASAYSASAAIASFSSAVNATNGSTTVTRESRDA